MFLNNQVYFCLFFVLLLVKVVVLTVVFYTGNDFFGGGNDSNYYHAYALGYDDVAVNAWPLFLRWLNEIGLYSREGVSFFLKILGLLAIPFMVARLVMVKSSPVKSKVFWMAATFIAAYPTLLYYTTDIYRDVFMVFLWLLGMFFLKWLSETQCKVKTLFYFSAGLLLGYVMYEFRPYLGFGYFMALFFSRFYSLRRYPFLLTLISLVFILWFTFLLGLLDPILKYRSIFHNGVEGGSNLGISFNDPSLFFVDFLSTVSFQLFGFFFVNIPAIFVFFAESLPFMFFIFYVVKNRTYSTGFIDCLIVFFVSYSIVWLLGNDNLGTAVRLRMYCYISMLIAFFIIYQRRRMYMSGDFVRSSISS